MIVSQEKCNIRSVWFCVLLIPSCPLFHSEYDTRSLLRTDLYRFTRLVLLFLWAGLIAKLITLQRWKSIDTSESEQWVQAWLIQDTWGKVADAKHRNNDKLHKICQDLFFLFASCPPQAQNIKTMLTFLPLPIPTIILPSCCFFLFSFHFSFFLLFYLNFNVPSRDRGVGAKESYKVFYKN